jgi:hypothetical protein
MLNEKVGAVIGVNLVAGMKENMRPCYGIGDSRSFREVSFDNFCQDGKSITSTAMRFSARTMSDPKIF